MAARGRSWGQDATTLGEDGAKFFRSHFGSRHTPFRLKSFDALSPLGDALIKPEFICCAEWVSPRFIPSYRIIFVVRSLRPTKPWAAQNSTYALVRHCAIRQSNRVLTAAHIGMDGNVHVGQSTRRCIVGANASVPKRMP